ncbi:hypothetical protein WA577_002315 [Blastocystis sp. JDR]
MASYPPFRVSCSLDDFRKKWDYLKKGERVPETELSVAGRIINKRSAGSKLYFYDIRSGETMLQVMSSLNMYDGGDMTPEAKVAAFKGLHKKLRTGDVIGIRGIPARTDVGELSVFPKEITLLSPCLWNVPREWYEIKDPEVKYRKRYLDLIVSSTSRQVFYTRSKIISLIRSFMEDEGFMEVETSILSGQAGGAVATPFHTHSNSQDQDLTLRISPELYLKELVVGGFDRVYELGKVFRNEGLDRKHNFEFTSIEAYMAYQDYTDWMNKTEQLLQKISLAVHDSTKVKIDDKEIDFKAPFRRIDVVDELTKTLGPLPNLNDEASIPALLQICKDKSISVSEPITLPRIIDTLIGHYIEPQCIQPTFIMNHPVAMSPLSKEHGNTGKSERFELFVNGVELVNAYTEQNDPVKQEQSFTIQGKQRESGDSEIPPTDATFVNAGSLSYE